MSLADRKAEERRLALVRRDAAFAGAGGTGADNLWRILERYRGRTLSGYMTMRTEIDPLPAMTRAVRHGPVGVPVIDGKGLPLRFRRWRPEAQMVPGTFGAQVPAEGDYLTPEIVIVPCLAFDRRGGRLGYGGGFYDRTLERLRTARPTLAIGFAFAAQEVDAVPLEPTDQPLDMIVTDREVIDV